MKRVSQYFKTSQKHETEEDGARQDGEEEEAKFPEKPASKRFSFERSTRWFKGQQVPMIFICTTLWHEEDFEMATLIRSGSV